MGGTREDHSGIRRYDNTTIVRHDLVASARTFGLCDETLNTSQVVVTPCISDSNDGV